MFDTARGHDLIAGADLVISNLLILLLRSEGETTNNMKENQKGHTEQEIRYQLAGWILFIICALSFIASSVKIMIV